MPIFEVSIVCSDGQACCDFVKSYMDNFSEITTGKNHPFGHIGKIHAKNYREMMRIINELKKNAGGVIEDISLIALEK
jgi:hypothetical protein